MINKENPNIKKNSHTNNKGRGPKRMGRKILRAPSRKKYEYAQMPEEQNADAKNTLAKIPPIGKDAVRMLIFAGVEEVGRNMAAIEYGDDIVIVDCGFTFGKPEKFPGIEYILPNIEYLEANKHKIKGLVVTHGHLDHIGGIAFLIEKLGNPRIYSRPLTNVLIQKRQQEVLDAKALDYYDVQKDTVLQLGQISISFFLVTHTIPDAMGIIMKTPFGDIVFTGDVKLDHDGHGEIAPFEKKEYGIFKDKNVIALLADSTNVENEGFSIPEHKVWKQLDKLISETRGRIILGTFASQLERVGKIIESAERHGRKIIIDGRSMKNNVAIAQKTGHLKIGKDTVIPIEQMGDYSPDKLLVLATGAQGQTYATLMRASVKTHKHLKFQEADTVILSSSIIPGTEIAVRELKDNITRHGCKLVTYQVSEVHASGHGNKEELKWIHKQVKPKFFVPIHGHHSMLRAHKDAAFEAGIPMENTVIPDNGSIIEIRKDKKGELEIEHLKQRMPNTTITVDGTRVGRVAELVIRDRIALSEDGIFNVILVIDKRSKRLRKMPDIISRGFIYLKESQTILSEARDIIKKNIEKNVRNMRPINIEQVKKSLVNELEPYLFQKTLKKPIIISTVLIV